MALNEPLRADGAAVIPFPSKAAYYTQMAEEAARQVTGSREQWTAFLTTAARLYKYPYNEQLMIYKQRPDATACAEYDLWNRTMRRYVRRGSKGIALVDNTGSRPKLRYVFDVSDTGERENSRPVNLWSMREEYVPAVQDALERAYGVGAGEGLEEQIGEIAAHLADEYWEANKRNILGIVDGSFLYGYDEFNVGVSFRRAAETSIKYMLCSRCVEDPESCFEPEDFMDVFDFNTQAASNVLGTAVSEASSQVFREIERAIRTYERTKQAELSEERSKEHGRADLHEYRGLSDPGHQAGGDGGPSAGQVRQDAEGVPGGEQHAPLQPPDADREAVPAPVGGAGDGHRPDGAVDEGTAGGGPGAGQKDPADGLGAAHERPESTGGGDRDGGAYQQLTLEGLFPSEMEQITMIDQQAESEKPSAFAMPKKEGQPPAEPPQAPPAAEPLTDLQKKAAEIAAKYESLPMREKIGIIAQAFGYLSGHIETSPCSGKWRGTSDIYIRFDNGATLGIGNDSTPKAKTAKVQNELINAVLMRYNPEIVAAAKETALAALRVREARDNEIAAQKGLKPYTLLNVELYDDAGAENGGYRGWYYVTLAVDGKLHAHLETGLNHEIAFGKVGEIPVRESYFTASGLKEADVDYVFNNVGFSSTSGMYSLSISDEVRERAEKTLAEREGRQPETQAPTIRDQYEKYKPVVAAAVMEDMPYRNACGHSDHENAVLEGNAAIKRAILDSHDLELIRLYSDVLEFHRRLHQEVIDETYPQLHELLRPLSQDDIDDALRAWNGNMDSKRAVVRYMKDHGKDADAAEWLSGEYSGGEGRASFVVRSGTELPWEEVQSRIAQLIQKDAFFTEAELDNFEDIDTAAVRRELENGSPSPFVEQVIADVERIAVQEENAVQVDALPKEEDVPERSRSITGDPSDAPDTVDGDLWELITTEGGLLNDDERSLIFSWISDGDSTGHIALRLSELLAGNSDTTPLVTGETADFSSSMNGVEITILDNDENKKDTRFFRWDEVTSALRALYQQERDSLSRQPARSALETGAAEPTSTTFVEKSVSKPTSEVTATAETVYPGDRNGLPFDVVVERLHFGEPEQEQPQKPDAHKELLINNYLQNIPSCAILSSNISNCIGGKNGYTC